MPDSFGSFRTLEYQQILLDCTMDVSTSINSAITALQTQIGALQRSLEDQTNQHRSEKDHLLAQSERLAEVVATRDSRIEELEEQNRRQARRIEFLESKQVEADRRESVANTSESTCKACRSPDDSNLHHQRPTVRPKEDAAAVAAARTAVGNRKVYFAPAPIAPKYLQNPQPERDDGTALRAMLALEKPSQIVAVDCFPGREWKVSVCELPKLETEEESAEIKREADTEEGDEKAVAQYSEVSLSVRVKSHSVRKPTTVLEALTPCVRGSAHRSMLVLLVHVCLFYWTQSC